MSSNSRGLTTSGAKVVANPTHGLKTTVAPTESDGYPKPSVITAHADPEAPTDVALAAAGISTASSTSPQAVDKLLSAAFDATDAMTNASPTVRPTQEPLQAPRVLQK